MIQRLINKTWVGVFIYWQFRYFSWISTIEKDSDPMIRSAFGMSFISIIHVAIFYRFLPLLDLTLFDDIQVVKIYGVAILGILGFWIYYFMWSDSLISLRKYHDFRVVEQEMSRGRILLEKGLCITYVLILVALVIFGYMIRTPFA